jgi:hypothetical protein
VPEVGGKLQLGFSKLESAMLCLQKPAWMHSMKQDGVVRNYAASYAHDWLDSIQRTMFLNLDLKDLVFVTGVVKATEFETVTSRESSFEHSVELIASPCGALTLSFGYSSSHRCSACPVRAWGPRRYWDTKSNQPASADQMLQDNGNSDDTRERAHSSIGVPSLIHGRLLRHKLMLNDQL